MISSWIMIWKLCKTQKKQLIVALIASFISGMISMTQVMSIVLTIQLVVGEITYQQAFYWILILAIICFIAQVITGYLIPSAVITAGLNSVASKRIALGDLLRNVHLGYFNNTSTGRIETLLTSTLAGIESSASGMIIGILGGGLGAISLLIALFLYEPKSALITFIGMIIYLIALQWQMAISKKNAPFRQAAQTNLSQAVVAFFKGIKITKAFSYHQGDQKLQVAIEESKKNNLLLTDKSMFSQIITQLIIVVFEVFIVINTIWMYYIQKEISVVIAIVLVIMSFRVFTSIHQAGSILSMVGMVDSAMKEVDEIEKLEIMKCINPKQSIENHEIKINNLSFSYDQHLVLEDISMTIKENSLTAIIGPSGSGKSTLCQLIPRFWDVTNGSITIGGANIQNVETSELMENISMVFQKTYLFEDTVLNNIRFSKPTAPFKEIKKAAIEAQCHDFIMSLPDGYNTILEEGGNSLSGGQKQRISIARAILKDAPIIILDEATSALDVENEHAIMKAIDKLTKNKTVVMIAHRMKTIQKADQIIALDKGKIVQVGSHDDLIKCDGIYQQFVHELENLKQWKIR